MPVFRVFTDGASRNNPGHSAIGIEVSDGNGIGILKYKEYTGILTNNQAEYKAILKAVDLLKKLSDEGKTPEKIEFYSDSQLMVNQINYEFNIKEPDLALLNNKFQVNVRKLNIPYTVSYVPRNMNSTADKLANEALDKRAGNPDQAGLDFQS